MSKLKEIILEKCWKKYKQLGVKKKGKKTVPNCVPVDETVSLSISKGEKLSTDRGAGLTKKGREKYNRATGSNLKAPAPNPKSEKDKGRKASFCARMKGVVRKSKNSERARASLRRWNCN